MSAASLLQEEDELLLSQMGNLGELHLALYGAEDKQGNEVNPFWADRNERAIAEAERDLERWEEALRSTRRAIEERRRAVRVSKIYEVTLEFCGIGSTERDNNMSDFSRTKRGPSQAQRISMRRAF